MSINPVIGFFGGVRATAFAAVALLALSLVAVQTWRVDYYMDKHVDALLAGAVVESANADNLLTIEKLRAANKELAEGRAIDAKRSAAALTTLSTDLEELNTRFDALRRSRQVVYKENSNAAAWSTAAVPADIYSILRQAGDPNRDR